MLKSLKNKPEISLEIDVSKVHRMTDVRLKYIRFSTEPKLAFCRIFPYAEIADVVDLEARKDEIISAGIIRLRRSAFDIDRKGLPGLKIEFNNDDIPFFARWLEKAFESE